MPNELRAQEPVLVPIDDLKADVLLQLFISGVVAKSLFETVIYALATRHIIRAVKAM